MSIEAFVLHQQRLLQQQTTAWEAVHFLSILEAAGSTSGYQLVILEALSDLHTALFSKRIHSWCLSLSL